MNRRVAVLASPGQLPSLMFHEEPRPEVQPDEVEITVEAAALNFKDVLLALGLIPQPPGVAARFGFECAGRVRRVGSAVKGLSPGADVVAIGSGCLASSVCVPAETVAHRPANLSSLEAVTVPIAFSTASYALEELARLRAGDRVLIHAAAGGVGLAAVQIAQHIGAEIFATAGSEEKRQYLRDLGLRQVMDSRTGLFADQVRQATHGRGVSVVLNSLSGDLMEKSLEVLAPHGRFIELGARDAIAGHRLALSAFARGASFCAVGYEGPLPGMRERLASVLQRLRAGDWQPLPMRVFDAAQAAEAFAFLAAARHIGKVVIELARSEAHEPSRNALISPAQGAQLFELCLGSRRANMAVSKSPLDRRLSQTVSRPAAVAGPQTRHARPAMATAFVAPRTPVEQTIADTWARHFGLEEIGVHDDFFELGGDSLLAVQVAYSVRSALETEFPTHLILERPTVAALAAHLDAGPATAAGSRLLVRLASGPAGPAPIFLVHPIGGHVYFYLPLAARLSAMATVYGIQAQGVDGEAPPAGSVEEMARSYIEAMRIVQPIGPYRIGGASFGGVVCFEIAGQLAALGESVELLALIDSPAPSSLPEFFRSDAEILAYLLAKGGPAGEHLGRLSELDEDEMLHYFLQHGGAGERLAPDASIGSVRHFLRLFRTNYDALVSYRPLWRLTHGLYFYPTGRDGFNPGGFEQEWAPYFETFDTIPVPGNHTTMNLPPNFEVIVQRIQAALTGTVDTRSLQAI